MEFLIQGQVYHAVIKRVKGKLKVFFETDDVYYKHNGFDLPYFCCKRMKCRWKILRTWKEDLVNQRLKNVVIFPE